MLINELKKIALKVTNKNITVSLSHAFCREQAASQMLKLPEGTETLLNHENTCTDKNHRTAPQTSKLLQPLQTVADLPELCYDLQQFVLPRLAQQSP